MGRGGGELAVESCVRRRCPSSVVVRRHYVGWRHERTNGSKPSAAPAYILLFRMFSLSCIYLCPGTQFAEHFAKAPGSLGKCS